MLTRTSIRRGTAAALLTSAAIAALSVTTTPATASTTANLSPTGVCDGVSCNGQDPAQAGCASGAYTAASKTDQGVLLELRYSPSCHANWARITPAQWGWHFTVYNDNGDHQDFRAFGGSSAWTNMVNGYPKSWACFDDNVCTPKA